MTTVVVVKKDGEIAIAADSQSTFGDTALAASFDARWNKIFKAHGGYFSICGSAAHDLVLQAALKKSKSLDFSSRPAIFDSFRKLHPKLKEDYFLKPDEEDEDAYESSQMTVLLANPHGIFGIFSLREVYEFERFWAIGSGRDYAIGAMQVLYDRPDMSAADIAKAGVETGCIFDVSSSLPMTSYTLKVAEA
ncbi:ATP-dependent protease HslVU (ClpYQ), peptidase subunit [Andreprevotia lacus DSM 23236]|jgi:ATP-dependent protease HslVU (ClpYQ) peptidase subunit|uniref:ATP-dependent protease HslVU (ClpYQ), peptidase subunit n=1 Tax=Andreprevotia lacus DSM 23236 TaxID=1121001 RepID=A0A1W1XEE0_9NEIS|nr:MFS transporter [Andreprevotia lacus]SMC22212.1 ATP-dependent protease HslVU (ClpYQ), peptidase subunit [Andreprevotia lacus DSM 23236]